MARISEILIEVDSNADFYFDLEYRIFTKEYRPTNIAIAVLWRDAHTDIDNKQWRRGIYNMLESKSTFTKQFSHVENFDDLKTMFL